VESYTLQVLTQEIRRAAITEIARFVRPEGLLLVIASGQENTDYEGKMPWPLTREDLAGFISCGLKELSFSDYIDNGEPPVRRFRAVYIREVGY
jgi:ubiquinone/menaquinone biosynthesis C-methylase UbiE